MRIVFLDPVKKKKINRSLSLALDSQFLFASDWIRWLAKKKSFPRFEIQL